MRVLDALVSTHKNTDPHLPIHRATHCWSEASFYIDFSRHETHPGYGSTWPLPNVWEGVTVEDQERADERIPTLLSTPAAHRWVSAEPLLGPIDLEKGLRPDLNRYHAKEDFVKNGRWGSCIECFCGYPGTVPREECSNTHRYDHQLPKCWVDTIIVGGESGPNARPCDVEWIRDIVRQCREAGVKCYVKQLGSNPTLIKPDWVKSRAGSDPSEWPEDLQVRELGWGV
jgi:hypothetical protein